MEEFDRAKQMLIETRATKYIQSQSTALRANRAAATQVVDKHNQQLDREDLLKLLQSKRRMARNGFRK